jgi:hypothetical protein
MSIMVCSSRSHACQRTLASGPQAKSATDLVVPDNDARPRAVQMLGSLHLEPNAEQGSDKVIEATGDDKVDVLSLSRNRHGYRDHDTPYGCGAESGHVGRQSEPVAKPG